MPLHYHPPVQWWALMRTVAPDPAATHALLPATGQATPLTPARLEVLAVMTPGQALPPSTRTSLTRLLQQHSWHGAPACEGEAEMQHGHVRVYQGLRSPDVAPFTACRAVRVNLPLMTSNVQYSPKLVRSMCKSNLEGKTLCSVFPLE
jgi:hypothetical protein